MSTPIENQLLDQWRGNNSVVNRNQPDGGVNQNICQFENYLQLNIYTGVTPTICTFCNDMHLQEKKKLSISRISL